MAGDTGVHPTGTITVALLLPAGTVHLIVPPTDPVIGTARLTGIDHPIVPSTNLPQGGLQLIRMNPTMVNRTQGWMWS